MLHYIISKRTNTTEKHISCCIISLYYTRCRISQNIHIQYTIHDAKHHIYIYTLPILLYVILDICRLYWLYQTKPWIFLKSDHPNGEVSCRCQVMPSLLVAKPQAWSPASSTAWTNRVPRWKLRCQQWFYNNINHGSPLETIRKALHLMKPIFLGRVQQCEVSHEMTFSCHVEHCGRIRAVQKPRREVAAKKKPVKLKSTKIVHVNWLT